MNEEMLKELLENEAAMSAMPKDTRDALRKQYEEMKSAREAKERRIADEMKKKSEAEDRKDAEKRKKRELWRREMLGLCVGEWTQNVPRNRRFALCIRKESRSIFPSGNDYCAIDLIRGYMGPYWGYYGTQTEEDQANCFYKDRIRKTIVAETEEQYCERIQSEFNFKINNNIVNKGRKFSICEYVPTSDNPDCVTVKITGIGEAKTWEEHLADLKLEFDK